MQAYPDIELDLDFSDRVVDVVDEGFDVVLRTGRPVDSRLSMRELGEFQLKLVGSPAYFARHGTPRCPEDLLRHTCLHYRFPNTGRLEEWPLRRADGEAPPQIPVSMVCNNIETRVCFALRDQGIACLPDFSIREALREGRLVSVLDAFCERRARFFLLWPSGRQVSPKLRAFIDFVAPRVIATLAEARLAGPVKPAADRNKTAAATERLIGTSTPCQAASMINIETPTYYTATKKYELSFPSLETDLDATWW